MKSKEEGGGGGEKVKEVVEQRRQMGRVVKERQRQVERSKLENQELIFFVNQSNERRVWLQAGGRLEKVIKRQGEKSQEKLEIIEKALPYQRMLVNKKEYIEIRKKDDKLPSIENKIKQISMLRRSVDVKLPSFNPEAEIQKERNLQQYFTRRESLIMKKTPSKHTLSKVFS